MMAISFVIQYKYESNILNQISIYALFVVLIKIKAGNCQQFAMNQYIIKIYI